MNKLSQVRGGSTGRRNINHELYNLLLCVQTRRREWNLYQQRRVFYTLSCEPIIGHPNLQDFENLESIRIHHFTVEPNIALLPFCMDDRVGGSILSFNNVSSQRSNHEYSRQHMEKAGIIYLFRIITPGVHECPPALAISELAGQV